MGRPLSNHVLASFFQHGSDLVQAPFRWSQKHIVCILSRLFLVRPAHLFGN